MKPLPSHLYVSRPLTNVLIAYVQTQDVYVSDRVFANIPTPDQIGNYFIFDKGDWFRGQARKRGLAQESRGISFGVSSDDFNCDVYANHHDIDDQSRGNRTDPINLDAAASELVARDLLLTKEIDFADKFFKTGLWTGSSTGTDITPTTLWDASGSTPLKDIRIQIEAVRKKTGFKPNKIVFPPDVWAVLQDHPDITSRLAITNTQIVTKQIVSLLLGVDEILEAAAVRNIAPEGATDAFVDVFSKDVLLVYATSKPEILIPSAGYTFKWTGYLGNSPGGYVVSRFRLQQIKSDRVEGESAFAHKLVAPDLGVFFDGVIS